MPYQWLGTWLMPEDRNTISAWLAAMSPEHYPTAQLNEWHLGAWVQSSVRTHLRCNTLDMHDERIASTYGSYLYSGGLAALGLDRLFDLEKPDLQLLFNGRMAPTRIALELAKQKNIRTIVEERSAVSGRMVLFEDVTCLDISYVNDMWQTWKDLPLTEGELSEISSVLEERRAGGKGEVSVFSAGLQNHQDVCQTLDLDPKKRLWVLFTSSEDEIVDKGDIESVFPSQQDWILQTLAYVSKFPDLQMVIRAHPNVSGDKALGSNEEDAEFYRELAKKVPSNVRVVQPGHDISSYTLADLCDLTLVWYSTIGIETAALGKRVVRGGGYMLEGCDFIHAPESPETYSGLLDSLRQPASKDDLTAIAIAAWRFAYVWFLRRTILFPLVDQPEWYLGVPTWASPSELKQGVNVNLDHICDLLLRGRPIHALPEKRETRPSEVEHTWIADRIQPLIKSVT